MNESVPAEKLEKAIRQGAGSLLVGVELFDVYRGPGVTAGARSLEADRQLFLDARLPDELVEPTGPKGALDLVVLPTKRRCEELLGHAALSACRTRSSGARSGSVPASARSASATV